MRFECIPVLYIFVLCFFPCVCYHSPDLKENHPRSYNLPSIDGSRPKEKNEEGKKKCSLLIIFIVSQSGLGWKGPLKVI